MTNFEKYKDEILEIVEYGDIASIAIDNKKNKPQYCSGTQCSQCIRYDNGHCSSRNLFKWLYEEAKEPLPTLTLKERAFCEIVKSGYIARDRDESLWVFSERPYERDGIWTCEDEDVYLINITREVFKFIDYKSRKAWSIEELLQLEVKK